jgi:hypothetical protein
MEDYTNLYQQHVRTVRKLIIDARYYRYHRASWEEDRSSKMLALAEINLNEAERILLTYLHPKEVVS